MLQYLTNELIFRVFDLVGSFDEVVNLRRVCHFFHMLVEARATTRMKRYGDRREVTWEDSDEIWERSLYDVGRLSRPFRRPHRIARSEVVPHYALALNLERLETLELSTWQEDTFTLDFLSLHFPLVTSFSLPHHPTDKEMCRFLCRRHKTLKYLSIQR
jgi:hypothetical protein